MVAGVLLQQAGHEVVILDAAVQPLVEIVESPGGWERLDWNDSEGPSLQQQRTRSTSIRDCATNCRRRDNSQDRRARTPRCDGVRARTPPNAIADYHRRAGPEVVK